jgi:hypothetical protein
MLLDGTCLLFLVAFWNQNNIYICFLLLSFVSTKKGKTNILIDTKDKRIFTVLLNLPAGELG